jgi:hypothetical protein
MGAATCNRRPTRPGIPILINAQRENNFGTVPFRSPWALSLDHLPNPVHNAIRIFWKEQVKADLNVRAGDNGSHSSWSGSEPVIQKRSRRWQGRSKNFTAVPKPVFP